MEKFSIEKLSQTVKKKPMLAIGAVLIAIGAGVFMSSRNGVGSSALDIAAAPAEGVDPALDEMGIGNATDPALLEILSNMLEKQDATSENLNYLNSSMTELLTGDAYANRTPFTESMNTPSSILADAGNVEEMISLIKKTPSFTSANREYSLNQISVISDWAANEQQAISSGAVGSSLNPVGAGEAGLIVEYHPTGHVSFNSPGSKTPTPKTYAIGSAASIANNPENAKKAQSAVSKVTGKGGNIENQLSGMTQAQKISTLKAAGY